MACVVKWVNIVLILTFGLNQHMVFLDIATSQINTQIFLDMASEYFWMVFTFFDNSGSTSFARITLSPPQHPMKIKTFKLTFLNSAEENC